MKKFPLVGQALESDLLTLRDKVHFQECCQVSIIGSHGYSVSIYTPWYQTYPCKRPYDKFLSMVSTNLSI